LHYKILLDYVQAGKQQANGLSRSRSLSKQPP
jgi:hypothetical protein